MQKLGKKSVHACDRFMTCSVLTGRSYRTATVYLIDSAACGAARARRCRDQPGGGWADDVGPQSAAAACVAARFEILGMHFTNELCNNCANHTISRNYIMQTLRNIRRHYANNTQSLRK